MGPMRVAVIGAPTYFALRAPPRTPDDLVRHNCIQFRLPHDGTMLEWPFERNGMAQRIKVEGRVTVNDPSLALRAALDGLGVAVTFEAMAAPFLRTGQLVRVLEDWSPEFEGFFLFYPGHRQVPAALRALIDMIRSVRSAASPASLYPNPFAAE